MKVLLAGGHTSHGAVGHDPPTAAAYGRAAMAKIEQAHARKAAAARAARQLAAQAAQASASAQPVQGSGARAREADR